MSDKLTDKEKQILYYALESKKGSLGFIMWKGGATTFSDKDIDTILKKLDLQIDKKNDSLEAKEE